MDIEDINNLWITTMKLAGCEDQQINKMFDDSGGIKKNINGWIMYINEDEDMKDASSINNILPFISCIKPLLIKI